MTWLIRPLTKDDITQVTAIDREAFPTMWPPVNFKNELNNRMASYLVVYDNQQVVDNAETQPVVRLVPARTLFGLKLPFFKPSVEVTRPPAQNDFIAGFMGMWIMVDEAHIINLAVRKALQGKGIGELLIIASIDLATKLGAKIVTLEVRVSNTTAQKLYTKYGFRQTGLRKGYYTDNNEDALIMTTDLITSTPFRNRFRKLKEAHLEKLGQSEYLVPV